MILVYLFAVFIFGVIVGISFCMVFKRASSYDGIIKINKKDDEDKTLYSLEINENLMVLADGDTVIFKVETSSESSNRE